MFMPSTDKSKFIIIGNGKADMLTIAQDRHAWQGLSAAVSIHVVPEDKWLMSENTKHRYWREISAIGCVIFKYWIDFGSK